MKKTFASLVIVFASAFLFSGCGSENTSAALTPSVAAGVSPIAWIIRQIAGNRINVVTLLPEGRNLHNYNPEPREVAALAGAKMFFSVKTNFEKTAAASLRGNLSVVDLLDGLNLQPIDGDHHEHRGNEKAEHHHDDGFDPHVWFDFANLKLMAEKITAELSKVDSEGREYFKRNLLSFNSQANELEKTLRVKLDKYAGKKFLVYHPAFGYFANTFKLEQVAIENDGREVTATQVVNIIQEAKKISCKIIFVQKGFNTAASTVVARQLGVQLIEIDPLLGNVFENMNFLADNIIANCK